MEFRLPQTAISGLRVNRLDIYGEVSLLLLIIVHVQEYMITILIQGFQAVATINSVVCYYF